ncbi:hypothetical protein [uncultured Thiodictyon sp.]|uniref:hypothetical protein n=1 Tax=uncultured Thiodictyon sp. TaxID=1846217 RepID=UPI0025F72ABA|nr:hypothetical protein [uncultured Thiodictyon sp.]
MGTAPTTVQIDGRPYRIAFQGFDRPLDISTDDGAEARLCPWTLGQHLATLTECLRHGPGGLALDSAAYAGQVLDASGVPEARRSELAPLALWWASGGGGGDSQTPAADGWLDLGGTRAQLRPWSAGERFAMLAEASVPDAAGGTRADPVACVRAMLRHTVTATDPPTDLDALDSGAAATLLAAAIAINDRPTAGGAVPHTIPDSPPAARLTLRLCRALGWTPSQVWATPAAEIDLLVGLLDRLESVSPVTPARGLAAHPDAVVIRIEDDR